MQLRKTKTPSLKVSALERAVQCVQAKPIVIAFALVLGTLALYAPVVHFQFLDLDDGQYVTDNPNVITGLSAANVAWAFRDTKTFYWHPLSWLSHMIDCQLFGLQSGPHHLVNVLLHACNVALLFGILAASTRKLWRSAVVAAIFACHPLNVETVAWVAERKSLLSALFTFLTLACYGWYVRQPGKLRYLVMAIAFSCALMSKPMAVTLPVLLLLVDFWPLQRIHDVKDLAVLRRLISEKLPLVFLSIASSLLTLIGQRSSMTSVANVPLSMRLGQGVDSYIHYLRKIFFPSNLSPFYPYSPHWVPTTEVILGLILLTVITTFVIIYFKKPFLLAGWLWFLLALVPVLGVLQVGASAIAERFTYIPAIGIFCMLLWGGALGFERFKVPPSVSVLICTAMIGGLALGTVRYLPNWATSVSVFSRAAQVVDPDPVLEDQLADALLRQGDVQGALDHSELSCRLKPEREICHVQIADIIFSQNTQAALEHYQIAAEYTKIPWLKTYCVASAGKARLALGDLGGAEQQLSQAEGMDSSIPAVQELAVAVAQAKAARNH